MDKIRTGIIGCGKVGDFHALAYSKLPESEFVAVCDSDIKRAEAFAARALMLMLTPESDSSHTTHSTRSAIPENLSRRDFFTTFSKEMIADDKP